VGDDPRFYKLKEIPMSVIIDTGRCICCGACAEICPGNLIRIRQGEAAFLPHPEECWGCASCLKACRAGAITYYLGADIGGRGGRMRVAQEGRFSRWIITLPDMPLARAASRRNRGDGFGDGITLPESPESTAEPERTVTITVDRNDANRY
jgi:adenylylsulfate reductase subunit B